MMREWQTIIWCTLFLLPLVLGAGDRRSGGEALVPQADTVLQDDADTLDSDFTPAQEAENEANAHFALEPKDPEEVRELARGDRFTQVESLSGPAVPSIERFMQVHAPNPARQRSENWRSPIKAESAQQLAGWTADKAVDGTKDDASNGWSSKGLSSAVFTLSPGSPSYVSQVMLTMPADGKRITDFEIDYTEELPVSATSKWHPVTKGLFTNKVMQGSVTKNRFSYKSIMWKTTAQTASFGPACTDKYARCVGPRPGGCDGRCIETDIKLSVDNCKERCAHLSGCFSFDFNSAGYCFLYRQGYNGGQMNAKSSPAFSHFEVDTAGKAVGQDLVMAGFHPVRATGLRLTVRAADNAAGEFVLTDFAVNAPIGITNIAYNKPTLQSSENLGGVGKFAVDGITQGKFALHKCMHTAADAKPWFRIDLGASYDVEFVVLHNRAEHSERLNGVQVAVLPASSSSLRDVGNIDPMYKCPDIGNAIGTAPGWVTCRGVPGRYVYVYLLKKEFLTLCEVEVYPSLEINLALGRSVQYPKITDGLWKNKEYQTLGQGVVSTTIDLGAVFALARVNVRHYFVDSRSYYGLVYQISEDNKLWENVFNADTNNLCGQGKGTDAGYAESEDGKNVAINNIHARYARFWSGGSNRNAYNHIAELEIYARSGSRQGAGSCGPVGRSARRSSSTEWNEAHGPRCSQLNLGAPAGCQPCWSARNPGTGDFLQLDLPSVELVYAVATQGRRTLPQWVTHYHLQYLDVKRGSWITLDQTFAGNADQNGIVFHTLTERISTIAIRFIVAGYHGHPSMRAEVYSCSGSSRNLAYRKPVMESTLDEGSNPERIVDGQASGQYLTGKFCSHTKKQNRPWARVDLEASYEISHLIVWTRSDGPSTNLIGFNSAVLPFIVGEASKIPANFKCAQVGYDLGKGESGWVKCHRLRGQYVYVYLPGDSQMSLCELEVYGQPDINVALHKGLLVPQNSYNPVYMGCFKDQPTRDITNMAPIPRATIASCAAIAFKSGHAHFGLQSGGQCFTGHTYGRYGPATNCNSKCEGDPTEICGGNWANSVYHLPKRDVALSPSPPGANTPNTIYKGCYKDTNAKRDLEVKVKGIHTIATCAKAAVAKRKRYLSLQMGGQCFVGDAPGKYGTLPEDKCNMKCKLDDKVDCGGEFAGSVYELMIEPLMLGSSGDKIVTDDDRVVDGNWAAGSGLKKVSLATHYYQLDLGQVFAASKVVFHHEWPRAITVHDVIVQHSMDKLRWDTIYNNDKFNVLGEGRGQDTEYKETEFGKTVYLGTTPSARYWRFWSKGNTKDEYNGIMEIQIFVGRTTNPVLAGEMSFESQSLDGFYMQYTKDTVKLSQVLTQLDRDDSTFEIVPGLTGSGISIKAVNEQHHYLRPVNERLTMQRIQMTDEFKKEVSFLVRPGITKASHGYISFESIQHPGKFLRHENFLFFLRDPTNPDDDRFSFRPRDPLRERKGRAGAPGARGAPGIVGPPGPQGPRGERGIPGQQGEGGRMGPKGFDIVGPKGPTGTPGTNGKNGETGEAGKDGKKGARGPKGDKGPQGPKGDKGVDGTDAPRGLDGTPGLPGPRGGAGVQGPPGNLGPKGDRGAPGPQGTKGKVGGKGRKGPQGPRGAIGATPPVPPGGLPRGDTGAPGINGKKGPPGHKGPPGDQGKAGPRGLQGLAGPSGPPGPRPESRVAEGQIQFLEKTLSDLEAVVKKENENLEHVRKHNTELKNIARLAYAIATNKPLPKLTPLPKGNSTTAPTTPDAKDAKDAKKAAAPTPVDPKGAAGKLSQPQMTEKDKALAAAVSALTESPEMRLKE